MKLQRSLDDAQRDTENLQLLKFYASANSSSRSSSGREADVWKYHSESLKMTSKKCSLVHKGAGISCLPSDKPPSEEAEHQKDLS